MPKHVLSFETLRKAGLSYLGRYAASTNAFKLVLQRKVKRIEGGSDNWDWKRAIGGGRIKQQCQLLPARALH